MDNTDPLNYQNLKKKTFQDIFIAHNKDASSLKRCLNYINYSKQDCNVINKQELNPIYREFQNQVLHYEMPKPPEYDLEESLKQNKKREKASLDKQNKKYII
mmetsp:Transcript_39021/g.37331  ORF Transcript_39021/g.37331 Transcript_39021/m.37331 type:complete len:102 (-) Transcript_39021:1298-1603(-)